MFGPNPVGQFIWTFFWVSVQGPALAPVLMGDHRQRQICRLKTRRAEPRPRLSAAAKRGLPTTVAPRTMGWWFPVIAAARHLTDVSSATVSLGRMAMRRLRNWLLALVACGGAGLAAPPLMAQPAGLNVGRDCQVVRTCNFGRSGPYRGCLSAFTCRVCRFVPARCVVAGTQRVCQRMRCTWGG